MIRDMVTKDNSSVTLQETHLSEACLIQSLKIIPRPSNPSVAPFLSLFFPELFDPSPHLQPSWFPARVHILAHPGGRDK